MKLHEYRLILIAVGLIGILLLLSPTLGAIIQISSGEQFSELYLLGPDHLAQNYPHDIVEGEDYSIYLGVGNHLGSSAYYTLYVKLQNETDPLPNATDNSPSPSLPLYEYQVFVPNNQTWESSVTFSISNITILDNQSIINGVVINGFRFEMHKPAVQNSNNANYNYLLVFELWLYNPTSNSFKFDNRFVDLRLNVGLSY